MKLYVLLDCVRSAYNVGSLFRTCDSAGIDKLILTGWCAVPPHPKLNKTALGSLQHVEWEHHCNAIDAVRYYKSQGIKVVCFETTPESESLFDYQYIDDSMLIFGNEEEGVKPEILALADVVIKIPQYGMKESLNIASAAAIGIYEFRRQSRKL